MLPVVDPNNPHSLDRVAASLQEAVQVRLTAHRHCEDSVELFQNYNEMVRTQEQQKLAP